MATTEGFHNDQRVPFYAVPELGSVFYGLPNTSHGQINRYFRELDSYFKPGNINYFKGNLVYPGEWSPTGGMSEGYYAYSKLTPEQKQEIHDELASRYLSNHTGSYFLETIAATGLPTNNHDIFGMDPDIGAINTPFIYSEGRIFTHPSARYHGDIVSNMAPEERQSIHWPSAIQGRYDPEENEYAIYHNEYPPVEYNDDEIAQALHQHFHSPKGHIASSPDDLHRFVYHRGRVKMAPSWDTYHQWLANELLTENEPATAPYGFAGGFYRPSTGELNRGEKLSLGGPPVPDEVLAQALRDKASELYGSSVHAGRLSRVD